MATVEPKPGTSMTGRYDAFKYAFKQAYGRDITEAELNDVGFLSTLSNDLLIKIPGERLATFDLARLAQLSNDDLINIVPQIISLFPNERLASFSRDYLNGVITDAQRRTELGLPAVPPPSGGGGTPSPATGGGTMPTPPAGVVSPVLADPGSLGATRPSVGFEDLLRQLGVQPGQEPNFGGLTEQELGAYLPFQTEPGFAASNLMRLLGYGNAMGNPFRDFLEGVATTQAPLLNIALQAGGGAFPGLLQGAGIGQNLASLLNQGRVNAFGPEGSQGFLSGLANLLTRVGQNDPTLTEAQRQQGTLLMSDPLKTWQTYTGAQGASISPDLLGNRQLQQELFKQALTGFRNLAPTTEESFLSYLLGRTPAGAQPSTAPVGAATALSVPGTSFLGAPGAVAPTTAALGASAAPITAAPSGSTSGFLSELIGSPGPPVTDPRYMTGYGLPTSPTYAYEAGGSFASGPVYEDEAGTLWLYSSGQYIPAAEAFREGVAGMVNF